ncbi:Six-hairpin glycosidase-like protein, partial [Syncephalis pseudoplumigaleata]
MRGLLAVVAVVAAATCLAPLPGYAAYAPRDSLATWIATQYDVSMARIVQSVQPNGAIYASPSRKDPDYYYFWTRDGGLTMDALASQLGTNATAYGVLFERFTRFTAQIQSTPNPSNSVGEPKFNMDGTAFTAPWGRPQNDGPAIRAFALAAYLGHLRRQDPNARVDHLYNPDLRVPSPIKTDLEYVSHRWRDSSFEIWEEVRGHHFYTRLVQHKSMRDGAKLAAQMNDPGAAAWYARQADAIEATLGDFWDPARNYIMTTLGRDGGLAYKMSNIDNQVILAALHAGDESTGLFAPWDDRVLATAKTIIDAFRPLYRINTGNPQLAPAIGRYPEDCYDGVGITSGNPWMLNTAAHAELLYRAYLQWARTGQVAVT